MPSQEEQKRILIDEINQLLEQGGTPLTPILRKAVRLADLCGALEYRTLFDLHLDGYDPNQKIGFRVQRWPDPQIKPKWNITETFQEDRSAGDNKMQQAPLEQIEILIERAPQQHELLVKNGKIKEAMKVTEYELINRQILARIRNRISTFIRETEAALLQDTKDVDSSGELVDSTKHEPSTSVELKHPEKVTLNWIIHNVEISLWWTVGSVVIGLVTGAFLLGISVGQTTFIQELIGKERKPTTSAAANPTPTIEALEDLPSSEIYKLSSFHMDTSKGYLEYGIHNNTDWTVKELIVDFTLFQPDNKSVAVKNRYRLALAPGSTGEPFKPSKYKAELGINLEGNTTQKMIGIVGARGIKPTK